MTMLAVSEVDSVLSAYHREKFSRINITELREHFQTYSIAPLRGFCPPSLLAALYEEATQLVRDFGAKKDLLLKITDNTPRRMTTVGQPIIWEQGQIIPAVYRSEPLRTLLTELVGEQVHICPYPGEQYVVSSLRHTGDTHGWHWDDYSLGLVWILEAPAPRDGGFVQCVPHTSWDKENPDVNSAFLQSPVYSYAFQPGDAYLLKTDTTMHRVYPIRDGAKRLIINMTWASEADLLRSMTHETNDVLFRAGVAS